jgi:hypothetical protein
MMATPTTETTDQRAGWQPFTIAAVEQHPDGAWLTLSAVSLAEAGVQPQVGDVGMCYVRRMDEPLLGQRIEALTIGEALLWDKRGAR